MNYRNIYSKSKQMAMMIAEASVWALFAEKRLPELAHCGTKPIDAMKLFFSNNLAEKRIVKEKIHGKIWLIVGLPKSASSGIGNMIAVLAKQKGIPGRRYADYMLANEDSNLRPELVRSFPNGGCLKYHPWAIGNNLKVIEDLGMKLFFTMRHPADQLVALWFHYNRNPMVLKSGKMLDHIFCNDDIILGDSIEDAISHLIQKGYLLSQLKFVSDWLNILDDYNGFSFMYEDMVQSRNIFQEKLSVATGVTIDSKLAKEIWTIPDEEYKRRANDDFYSGKVGVYSEIFSERNKEEFNEYIEKVECIMDLKKMQKEYGSLTIK